MTLRYRTISSEEDAAKLQHDLNMLAASSDTWHMNFNADECAVVQVKKGSNYVYTLNGKELASVKQQKDLGLLVSSNLMPRNHIETICSKVNRKTGMTKRCYMNKSQKQMTKIHETVSRPVLEYASTVWSPWLKKDIELLENTQDRALRLGNTNHVYETLKERRNRAQLMDTYKYLNNYYITPARAFLQEEWRENEKTLSETIQKTG